MHKHTYKNIRRLNKIVVTLIRYGFGGLVAQLRIFPYLSTIERVFISKKAAGASVPVRIRLVLEDLGPTFIKLGQIASTRADILPPDWIEEFKKLQDMVPPFSFDEVKKEVEKSLGGELADFFSSFDPEPVASASIAQVHHAVLSDGTSVAVKVRRPEIGRIIESDMSVMHTVAALLVKYAPASRRYRPVEVVDEFERVITNEQDLSIEGVNINRFYDLFKDDPTVQIPRVYWDYTTPEVLTMERISGTPIDEAAELRARGIDVKATAVRGLELFFKQVFEYGIFHADLHPGNIFVRDDGVIIYLDFGIVGRIDKNLRRYLASLLYNLLKSDYRKMALIHMEMGLISEDVDLVEFEEALRDICEPIYGKTLEKINISALLMKLLQTARHFNMRLQPNLLLLQKSMVIIEGVGRQLYPDIDMWEVAQPLIYKWMLKEKLSPMAAVEKGKQGIEEVLGAAYELPVGVNALVKRTLAHELKINFALERIDTVSDGLEDIGRRVGGGIVAGSIVLASTLIGLFGKDWTWGFMGLPAVSWIGYLIAAFLCVRFFPQIHGRD